MRKPNPRPIPPLEFYWLPNPDLTSVRVWRSDWYGDQFETMKEAEFHQFQVFTKKFGFPLIFKETDED